MSKGLGKPYTFQSLMEIVIQREEYLRLNKAWSDTFDGLHRYQLNSPYFPENKPESPKSEDPFRSGSPMEGVEEYK
jgi:hypothetical protein